MAEKLDVTRKLVLRDGTPVEYIGRLNRDDGFHLIFKYTRDGNENVLVVNDYGGYSSVGQESGYDVIPSTVKKEYYTIVVPGITCGHPRAFLGIYSIENLAKVSAGSNKVAKVTWEEEV